MRMLTRLRAVLAHPQNDPYELDFGPRGRFWRYRDGSILPVVAGGSPELDDLDPDPVDPEPDDPPPDPDPEPTPDDPEPPATPKPEPFDEERALRTIRKQREAEKKLKADRDKLKAERDALRAEKETEQERTTRLLEETKAENERLREQSRSATIDRAIADAAIEGGVDPKRIRRALRLIDRKDIEIDGDGDVSGADDAVEDFLTEFPEFKVKEPEPEPDPSEEDPPEPPRRRGANPDRKRNTAGELSHKDAVRLSARDPEKFAELLAEGKIPRSALGGSEYDKLKADGRLTTASAEAASA